MKVLFLYTELANYFLTCVNELSKHGVEVHIVRWPVNNEAPFKFEFSQDIIIYDKANYTREGLTKLALDINPGIIYCSGWIDKDYLSVCRKFKNKIPVIVGFDNQWTGSLKQNIACMIAPFTIKRYFSHCWVPGSLQYTYAKKLGFNDRKILSGFYSADVNFFHDLYEKSLLDKKKNFPKRFIYVGRYYEFKGVKDLWETFIEIDNEVNPGWELWCLGTGDIDPVIHPKIKHFGFVQQKEMDKFISNCGVFVLPSHFEPWGVVVHEFAAAGFPLVISDSVGSRTSFLKDNYNGYIYKGGDKIALKNTLLKIMNLSDSSLLEMGGRSLQMAQEITPQKWVRSLITLFKKK